MRALAPAVAVLLLSTVLSGCAQILAPQSQPQGLAGSSWSMVVPITVNVVAVGFDGRLDGERLLDGLATTRPVFDWARSWTTREIKEEPIQYEVTWVFHEAPAAFAEGFFDAAEAASFDGPAPAYLVDYDRTSGEMRFAHPPVPTTALAMTPLKGALGAPTMTYIDAPTVEDWVHGNRAAHGLAFPEPEYTVFLVDSYTDGHLPKDTYHYWYFDDGTIDADLSRPRGTNGVDAVEGLLGPDHFHTPKDPTSQRGWGGKHGFLWLDVGAAPSWLDDRPWVPPFDDDNFDHPIWALEGEEAKLYRNLNRHLEDFLYVKVARLPIYEFAWTERWSFPVHVFVESAAVSGKATPTYGLDVETWLGAERIERAFEELAPWVDTEVTVEYHYLPQDDPGMAAAVRRAKLYGDASLVNAGVIKDHVRANWDQYLPDGGPGVRTFPQFMFYFDGLWTFWGPNQGGGFADSDAHGRPWAAFNHIFDVCVKTDEVPCTKATKWEGEGTMDMLVIHEGGHHVGLTHARDTGYLDEERETQYRANWFYDSTWSVMTYRHQNPGFDRFDKDVVARGHAGWTLALVAERLAEEPPEEAAAAARQGVRETEDLLRQGRWEDAARRGAATWTALRDAPVTAARTELPTTPESFGGAALVPASLGAGGVSALPWEVSEAANVRATTFKVREDAQEIHISFRDTRPDLGALRWAALVLFDAEDRYAGGVFDDVYAEAHVKRLGAPGTYTAYLLTSGGAASEYELVLDVHYPSG